ncbi:MAG: DUF3168 domain-containing protein [Burkholderiaceae bacterium]|nr:DUF3168 domain-containing protein [Burkholderiaceae bacterium]
MTVSSAIYDALKGLVGNRVYQGFAPDPVIRPYIVHQPAGGQSVNFIDGSAPSLRNRRVQVNVWAATPLEAETLAAQVEDAMRAALSLRTTVLGSPAGADEPELKLYGRRQDFSVWY